MDTEKLAKKYMKITVILAIYVVADILLEFFVRKAEAPTTTQKVLAVILAVVFANFAAFTIWRLGKLDKRS